MTEITMTLSLFILLAVFYQSFSGTFSNSRDADRLLAMLLIEVIASNNSPKKIKELKRFIKRWKGDLHDLENVAKATLIIADYDGQDIEEKTTTGPLGAIKRAFTFNGNEGTARTKDPHADLGIIYTGTSIKDCNIVRSDFIKNITFPDPQRLDEFRTIAYDKLLADFIKSTKMGHFNICFLRETISLFGGKVHYTVEETFDNLRMLHCVDYKNIPPDILQTLPEMITEVFAKSIPIDKPDVYNNVTQISRCQ